MKRHPGGRTLMQDPTMVEPPEGLAGLLRRHQRAMGLPVRTFAARLGVSTSGAARLLRGEPAPQGAVRAACDYLARLPLLPDPPPGVVPLRDMDALVLAGGESSRMGAAKPLLPFGETTLVGTVVARLRPFFRRVLVVSREPGQAAGVTADAVTDGREERGPLVGLVAGLRASGAAWCFAVGCDMPSLDISVIGLMASHIGASEPGNVVVAHVGGRLQTLHAFYGRTCLRLGETLVGEGNTSLRALFPRCSVLTVAADLLRALDPGLQSFRDIDTPADLEAARQAAGLSSREGA
ncbi:MAG: molybdenum cofactor guanylyltransferase [Chloroflexi bacterium]|nr:molybdenum cofactor guanylyltransferase [Chloroflexota bacterium]